MTVFRWQVGNHRRFIDNKKRVFMQVFVELESIIRSRPLAVNFLMNSLCRLPCVKRQHFCCPACRREQNYLLFQFDKRLNKRADKARFACSGITFEQKKFRRRLRRKESRQLLQCPVLVGSRLKRQLLFYFIANEMGKQNK